MKPLYTKKQVKTLMSKFYLHMIGKAFYTQQQEIEKCLKESNIKGIELPTDEEIARESRNDSLGSKTAFLEGAEFILNKIKEQTK